MARLMLNLQARAEGGRDFLTTVGSPSNPQSTTMIFSSGAIDMRSDEEASMAHTGTTMFLQTGELEDSMWSPISPSSPEELELHDVQGRMPSRKSRSKIREQENVRFDVGIEEEDRTPDERRDVDQLCA